MYKKRENFVFLNLHVIKKGNWKHRKNILEREHNLDT